MDLAALVLALVTLAVGGVAGFLFAQTRGAAARAEAAARVASLTSRLEASESQRTTAELAFTQRLAEAASAGEATLRQARDDAAAREAEVERRQLRALAEADERHAGELDRVERAQEQEKVRILAEAEKRVAELRADTKRLSDEFEALSRKALSANAEEFLKQAEERFRRSQAEQAAELAKREEAVKTLVAPLEKTLAQVKDEVSTAERARLQAHAALSQQVQGMKESSELLRTETSALVTALRAPQVRGQWGEMQLRRTVEAAGMVDHVDFEEQVQLDGGALRPDLVVTLPGQRQVVVDAKVAFAGYLEAMEARDDETRKKRLAAHARHMRTHIDALGSKEYWSHLETAPEFTVMFVPSEVFLDAALQQDPTLQEYAFSKNIVPATPSTLIALLRTVAYTWRQEKLAAEAQQVFTVGRELHKRLATFGSHLDTLAKRLNSTVDAFNRMTSSLDRNVVTQVRRLSELQDLEPAFEAPAPLEVLATAPQKSDLYGGTEPSRLGAAPADLEGALAEQTAVLGSDSTDDDLLIGLTAAATGTAGAPGGHDATNRPSERKRA